MSENQTLSGQWRKLVEPLLACGADLEPLLLDPADPHQRADACELLLAMISSAYVSIFPSDPYHPRFTPMFNEACNAAAPNGDTIYLYTPLADDGVYRIAGNRGTSRQCVLVFGPSLFMFTDTLERMDYHVDLDDIPRSDDGEFEFLMSQERPDGFAGHWVPLPAGTSVVVVRNIACDWLREQDAVLTIECLNRSAALPRPSIADIERKFALVPPFPRRFVAPWQRLLLDMRAKGAVNRLRFMSLEETGGLVHQAYYEGLFEIGPDEALIVETSVPDMAFYWSILLTDPLYRTIGYMDRQSTLNDVQATLDSDGKFRAVIASSDPGVPNWLDTGGHSSGSIQGRWNKCSGAPLPEVRKVPFAAIRQHLPPDTRHVTPAERDAAVRARILGGQRRRRW